jgi:hypothetical protein
LYADNSEAKLRINDGSIFSFGYPKLDNKLANFNSSQPKSCFFIDMATILLKSSIAPKDILSRTLVNNSNLSNGTFSLSSGSIKFAVKILAQAFIFSSRDVFKAIK